MPTSASRRARWSLVGTDTVLALTIIHTAVATCLGRWGIFPDGSGLERELRGLVLLAAVPAIVLLKKQYILADRSVGRQRHPASGARPVFPAVLGVWRSTGWLLADFRFHAQNLGHGTILSSILLPLRGPFGSPLRGGGEGRASGSVLMRAIVDLRKRKRPRSRGLWFWIGLGGNFHFAPYYQDTKPSDKKTPKFFEGIVVEALWNEGQHFRTVRGKA